MPSSATSSRAARPTFIFAAMERGRLDGTARATQPGQGPREQERHRDRRRVVGAAFSCVARAGRICAGVVLACRAEERHRRSLSGRSDLCTGRCAGPLRRSAAERVLRQPVRRSHAAAASFTRHGARSAAEPRGRWAAPLALHRIAALRREFLHRRTAASRACHARWRVACRVASRAPAGGAPPARTFDGGAAGCAAIAGAQGERRVRLLRMAGAGSSGGQRRRRPRLRRSSAGVARSRASWQEARRSNGACGHALQRRTPAGRDTP